MHGRELHIVPSSKQYITIANSANNPDFEDSGLSREYRRSQMHRFKDDNSRQFQYIRPPCETLHVSNVPPHFDDQVFDNMPTRCDTVATPPPHTHDHPQHMQSRNSTYSTYSTKTLVDTGP